MSCEQALAALGRAIDAVIEQFPKTLKLLSDAKECHLTACAKRKRKPHVKRRYIRR